jgi:voltage-gated potassium channel
MVVQLLPIDPATKELLRVYENTICVVFLIDFAGHLIHAPVKRAYIIDQRGWLDLLGSIPTLGFSNLSGLLRLARLSRLGRIVRVLRGDSGKHLLADMLRNRGQYAVFVTTLLAVTVLMVASVLVLQVEVQAPNANITTGGDALWWAIVTITTVGYGDQYPVTTLGRTIGVIVMFAGVGIIGALAGVLSSFLIPAPETDPTPAPAGDAPLAEIKQELVAVRGELAALRQVLDRLEHV